jgi:hypothetical protein
MDFKFIGRGILVGSIEQGEGQSLRINHLVVGTIFLLGGFWWGDGKARQQGFL